MSVFRKLTSALSTLLVVIMVALAVLLVGVRLVGLTPYTVLSGSMEPAYPVGSMIYIRRIEAQDIRVGMPLTFRLSGGAMVATHRVHELTIIDGETRYITKGDANDMPDPPVSYASVIGAPVFSIPYLGYFSSWLQSETGLFAGIAFAALLILSLLITELFPADPKPPQPPVQGEESPEKPQPGTAASPVSKAPAPENT